MKKIFKINNKIYLEGSIKQTIYDFKDLSEITYNKGNLEIIGNGEEEIEEIFNEFMNYYIGLVNE